MSDEDEIFAQLEQAYAVEQRHSALVEEYLDFLSRHGAQFELLEPDERGLTDAMLINLASRRMMNDLVQRGGHPEDEVARYLGRNRLDFISELIGIGVWSPLWAELVEVALPGPALSEQDYVDLAVRAAEQQTREAAIMARYNRRVADLTSQMGGISSSNEPLLRRLIALQGILQVAEIPLAQMRTRALRMIADNANDPGHPSWKIALDSLFPLA